MKIIHNVETGEIIERELTKEELAQQVIDEKASAAREAEKAKAEAAKSAVLEKLGLTIDDLKALGL